MIHIADAPVFLLQAIEMAAFKLPALQTYERKLLFRLFVGVKKNFTVNRKFLFWRKF